MFIAWLQVSSPVTGENNSRSHPRQTVCGRNLNPFTKQMCQPWGAPVQADSGRRRQILRYWPWLARKFLRLLRRKVLSGRGPLSRVGDKFLIGWSADQRTERLTREEQQLFDYSMFASRIVHIVWNCCALWPWRTGSACSGWSRRSTVLLKMQRRRRGSRRLGAVDKTTSASKGRLSS